MNGKIGPPQVARELLLSLLHNHKHAAHLQRMALGCVGFRFVSSIAEGVPAWSLKDELIALEQRQEKLEREIARGPEPQPLLHPNLAGLYRQKVAALEEALADPEEGAQAMEMIRLLIDALVLTRGEKLRVDLTGALAASSALPRKAKGPVRRTRPMHRT